MGGLFSSQELTSSENSRVKVVHSSARWQLEFNALKDTSYLVLVDFSATWCGPCRFMEPFLDAMSNEYTDVEFFKIDVDELSDVAKEFKVQAMPTFLLLKKGKEVGRIVGAKKDELKKKIEEYRVT